ncbi:putative phi PVL-like protein [Staphylococcus aureus]|uniref:acetyltransferase n=1 Tax=Staphylococcus aureus TaxID=1280 RepID=UPI000BBAB582|nr:acetyltransferase [Staphylococcus aureus]CAC6157427.1 putative phi PVL-like protein [Staphylococcus aureus]CAC8064104.1 putative phi PVL-like protein [Staphylococcus aureus]CAC8076777.1 putative phi PVL-like protein [Staphylococcus aureus]CAC8338081.1 putative phi PVL-like protein [Staphylococcus aureus]HDC9431665.1 acetyltransferase [Staphylococcus aureus]
MTRPTREELLSYFKKYGVERVNSITGEESAIHYFRTKAFYYREENKKLSENIDKLEKRNKELENMWRTLKNELFGRYEFYRFRLSELQIESRANRIGALYIGGKSTADIILSRMEELDGTNEFYEFLGEMEEDTNE